MVGKRRRKMESRSFLMGFCIVVKLREPDVFNRSSIFSRGKLTDKTNVINLKKNFFGFITQYVTFLLNANNIFFW